MFYCYKSYDVILKTEYVMRISPNLIAVWKIVALVWGTFQNCWNIIFFRKKIVSWILKNLTFKNLWNFSKNFISGKFTLIRTGFIFLIIEFGHMYFANWVQRTFIAFFYYFFIKNVILNSKLNHCNSMFVFRIFFFKKAFQEWEVK